MKTLFKKYGKAADPTEDQLSPGLFRTFGESYGKEASG